MKTLFLVLALSLAGVHTSLATVATLSARFGDTNDLGRCSPPVSAKRGSCPTCTTGMPRWWVTEPYINLWLADEPLSYTTSSGQPMAFRWTFQHRAKLPDPLYSRVHDIDPPWVPTRLDEEYFAVGSSTFRVMTNAVWSHNWWSEIVFWDPSLENSSAPATFTQTSTNAYFPMTSGYQGVVKLGDGGMIPFYSGDATSPAGPLKAQVQILGQHTSLNGPEVPVSTNIDGQIYDYPTNSAGLVWISNPQHGFQVVWPDGSKDIYGFVFLDHADDPSFHSSGTYVSAYRAPIPFSGTWTVNNTSRAYLTQHIDPQGRVTSLGYQAQTAAVGQPIFVLRYVVDPDGRTNTYSYNSANLYQLQQIQDPYGRTATFGYNSTNGMLASITDAAQLTSSFGYNPPQVSSIYISPNYYYTFTYDGVVSNLTTPYGQTTFQYYDQQETNATDNDFEERAIFVAEPQSAHQLFLFRQANLDTETNYLTAGVPTVSGWTNDNGTLSSPGGTTAGLQYRNTYVWGREQFANAVSSLNLYNYWEPPYGSLSAGLASLAVADYHKARLKHWLLDGTDSDQIVITDWLSSERPPSPDAAGLTLAPRTWYAYQGQPANNEYESALYMEPLIGCLATSLPDGSSQSECRNYDSAGNLTNQQSSYSRPDGTVGQLTNTFAYATNNIDLLGVTNSAGQWANLGYNAYHQVLAITNALNQVATLTWDSGTHNLTGLTLPSGAGFGLTYAGLLSQIALQPQGRYLNITAYTNGLPQVIHATGTGLPDLWLTNTWDGLNRLTGTLFPDGSTVSNIYTALDLTGHQDRLGHWTYYGYDGLEHLTAITNANNAVTLLSWCSCGALTSLTDALTNTTSYEYDNQGNLTNTLYPDGSSLARAYDSAERLISASDGAGRTRTFFYNNQGLLSTVSNSFGALESVVYDALNRAIQMTDANQVTVTNQYDLLNQLIARTWPDGIGEGFLWASNGLVAYTNRDAQVTHYGRDAAGRLLAVTNANVEVTQFAYDALDQVTSLIDGLNHTTTWTYNQYGWLTNKVNALGQSVLALGYNANGWVTNRWTPQMGNTAYTRDAVGNVLSINYPFSTNTYAYDALNRLTNMVDGVGATAFGYTPAGRLASETGPWTSGTVSNAYTQGLRTSQSINSPLSTINYTYDSAWRLTGLASPAGTFAYSYAFQPASSLVTGLSLPNGASITNAYDGLARLTQTSLNNHWGHALDAYQYAYDALGLRTNIVRYFGLGTNSVGVGYDNIGQLTSWKGQESSGLPRLNEQLAYAYDAAHNLVFRTNAALAQSFVLDPLNELTNETRNGALLVSGVISAPATNLTVSGQAAQAYGDFTFAATNQALNNGLSLYTVVARNKFGQEARSDIAVTLPSPVTLQYDANGSLTNDGTRTFFYDPENRLTNVNVAGAWKSEFVYDGLGRRRIERDYTWQSSAWSRTNETHFIYDGSLLIQERDSNNVVRVTYTRGLDLSGTRTGAGGIGGLLARTDGNGSTYYHSDGEGNITALIDGNQLIQARYLYDPFGRMLGEWGSLATANTMQFSSMPRHSLSGLSLYPFRAYDPVLHRWTSQDPLGEIGGINLYEFAANNPLTYEDSDGRELVTAVAVGVTTTMTSGGVGTSTALTVVATAVGGAGGVGLGEATLVVAAIPAVALTGVALVDALGQPPSPTIYPGMSGGNPIPISAQSGIILGPGEYRDHDGNVRDQYGNIVRDKSGRDVGPKKPQQPKCKKLQSGGNTLKPSTANALDNSFGTSPGEVDWGQALEDLKQDNSIPNNFHSTSIYDNGDVVLTQPLGISPAGTVIGNLGDYIP